MNFPVPEAFMHGQGDDFREHLYQPVTRPGDVVFFSEATVHGALPWQAEHERRVALYRFAPATCAYGRSYTTSPNWPPEMLEGTTPAQLAVLQPPFANRLDRPVLPDDGGDPTAQGRAQVKKDFDA